MDKLIPIAFLIVLFFGAYTTVTAPKVWQRTVSLISWVIILALLVWASFNISLVSYQMQYNSSVMKPTGELWNIVATNLSTGNNNQAQSDVLIINKKWIDIHPFNTNTVTDLVREIRENQQGEQAGPGYPPQSVGSPDP